LSDAVANELITKNVAATKPPPKPDDDETIIVQSDALPVLIEKLKSSARLYAPAMVSLFTACGSGRSWPCVGAGSI
jgi:hypothetical protein